MIKILFLTKNANLDPKRINATARKGKLYCQFENQHASLHKLGWAKLLYICFILKFNFLQKIVIFYPKSLKLPKYRDNE